MNYETMTLQELSILEKKLEQESNIYSSQEQAIKLLLNSLFGACGNRHFRYYALEIAESITVSSQYVIRWAEMHINKYLKQVPSYWDIICVSAIGKNREYEGGLYKFLDDFDSIHFYIINHNCMERLFRHMYPITDQVDVLISELIHALNIYNIPDTYYCIES